MENRPMTNTGRTQVKRRMDKETGRTILTRMEPTKTINLEGKLKANTPTHQGANPTNRNPQKQRAAAAPTKEPKQKEGDHKRKTRQTNTSDGRQTKDRQTRQKRETRTKTKGSNRRDNQPPRRRAHTTEERPRNHHTTMGDPPISTRTQEVTKTGNKPKTN